MGPSFFMRSALREIHWKNELAGLFNSWYVVSRNNR